MYKTFLIKYAEIAIKGKNRYIFEDALVKNIKYQLRNVDGSFEVRKESGRVYVETDGDYDYDETVATLSRIFGIVGICPVEMHEDEGFEKLCEAVIEHINHVYKDKSFTFKVNARRARKNYPMTSMEINAAVGEKVLEAFPETRVDVHNPQVMINIEIRPMINIYSEEIPGPGGMPLGTAGKAMLLLSGGIDSPVAGYMIAKRGVTLDAVYFHSPPYTSERAKDKVVDLAKIVAQYSRGIKLYVVPFTDIQLDIIEKCPKNYLTVIMRRIMMRIAEKIALSNGAQALITGESIGQVASQTMEALYCTNSAVNLPVFRPCIGMDKEEIVKISKQIDAYETSIQPYEDCCTIFVPKHPKTKPKLDEIAEAEKNLSDIEFMINEAIEGAEVLYIN